MPEITPTNAEDQPAPKAAGGAPTIDWDAVGEAGFLDPTLHVRDTGRMRPEGPRIDWPAVGEAGYLDPARHVRGA